MAKASTQHIAVGDAIESLWCDGKHGFALEALALHNRKRAWRVPADVYKQKLLLTRRIDDENILEEAESGAGCS